MPAKPHSSLHPFDHYLREAFPVTNATGLQLRIDKIVGFELFNTRPYHNYETWSDGYVVSGPTDRPSTAAERLAAVVADLAALGVDLPDEARRRIARAINGPDVELLTVEREDLDDAVEEWLRRRDVVRRILDGDPGGDPATRRTRLAVLGYYTAHGAEERVR